MLTYKKYVLANKMRTSNNSRQSIGNQEDGTFSAVSSQVVAQVSPYVEDCLQLPLNTEIAKFDGKRSPLVSTPKDKRIAEAKDSTADFNKQGKRKSSGKPKKKEE